MPAERHDHYDPDGNLTGYTVVTHESAWDERQATRALALHDYEANLHVCGHHVSEIDGETPMLVPDEFTCPFCAAQQLHARNIAAKDEKVPKPKSGHRHPLDGVSRFLRPARPDEIARHQERIKEVGRG